MRELGSDDLRLPGGSRVGRVESRMVGSLSENRGRSSSYDLGGVHGP